jgi:hypothetical protein
MLLFPESAMSLYYTQKLLYDLNRNPQLRARYLADLDAVLPDYDLTVEEQRAFRERDIGLLYVLGVNGQLLMHMSAYYGMDHVAYRTALRDGVRLHGPVRAGLYAMTTALDPEPAAAPTSSTTAGGRSP